MAELIPIEEHELLVFWVQLFVILVFARSLGWMMRKIGLPGVIGELGAGLLLGPSVFGTVWPDGFNWFLNEGHEEVQSAALLGVAWVGVDWCGSAWRGVVWHGVASGGVTIRVVAWRVVAWRGVGCGEFDGCCRWCVPVCVQMCDSCVISGVTRFGCCPWDGSGSWGGRGRLGDSALVFRCSLRCVLG